MNIGRRGEGPLLSVKIVHLLSRFVFPKVRFAELFWSAIVYNLVYEKNKLLKISAFRC
jgi:hypothetical protein